MMSASAAPEAPEALEAENGGARLTTKQAAELLGLSARSVRRLARARSWTRASEGRGGLAVTFYRRTDIATELVRREGGAGGEGPSRSDRGYGPRPSGCPADNGADSRPGAGRTTDPGHDRADMAGPPMKLPPEILEGLRGLAALPTEVQALRAELRRGRDLRAFLGGAVLGVVLVVAAALAGPALALWTGK